MVKVLIVDDRFSNRKAFSRYFKFENNIEIMAVESADEASKLIDSLHGFVDIIIADQQLNGTRNGEQLLLEVKNKYPKCYRVLTSGNDNVLEPIVNDPDLSEVVQKFINKPWDMNGIKKIICSLDQNKN
jgi:DNA-binding NtrC family response regulator